MQTLGLEENSYFLYCGDNWILPGELRELAVRAVKGKIYENGFRCPISLDCGYGEVSGFTCKHQYLGHLVTLCKLTGPKLPDVPLDRVDLVLLGRAK